MCDEHRVALELAENCRNAARMGSAACQGAIHELQQHWPSIMRHFQWEERELYPTLPPHQKRRLLSEHAAIRHAFAHLTASPTAVAAFAILLQNHVMWEETEIMFFAEPPGAVIKSQTIPGTMSASTSRTMSLGLEDEHEDAFNIYNNFVRPNPYGPVTPDAHLVRPLAGVDVAGFFTGGGVALAATLVGGAFTLVNLLQGHIGRAAMWGAGSAAVAIAGGAFAASSVAKGNLWDAATFDATAPVPLPMSPAFTALPKK